MTFRQNARPSTDIAHLFALSFGREAVDLTAPLVDEFEFSDQDRIPVVSGLDDTDNGAGGTFFQSAGTGTGYFDRATGEYVGPPVFTSDADEPPADDADADPAPGPVVLAPDPEEPTNLGRGSGSAPGASDTSSPTLELDGDHFVFGRDASATPTAPTGGGSDGDADEGSSDTGTDTAIDFDNEGSTGGTDLDAMNGLESSVIYDDVTDSLGGSDPCSGTQDWDIIA